MRKDEKTLQLLYATRHFLEAVLNTHEAELEFLTIPARELQDAALIVDHMQAVDNLKRDLTGVNYFIRVIEARATES